MTREKAIEMFQNDMKLNHCTWSNEETEAVKMAIEALAQPEPISEAYAKAVFTWLLDYQIKAAELKGRYTPYEVLSWVANDWRKEFIEGREE